MSTMERTAAETFAHLIRLHLDNDEWTYNERREIVADAVASSFPGDYTAEALGSERAMKLAERGNVADALREFVEVLAFGADDDGPTVPMLGLDLLMAVMGEVDWFAMADEYIAEHYEEQDADA